MASDRPCTPPPPRADYMRYGAIVSTPALRPPALPSEREIDLAEAPLHARAAEELDALVLAEMRALVRSRPSVPARKARP